MSNSCDKRFGVRVPAPIMMCWVFSFEDAPQVHMVVDFTIEGDYITPATGLHWLAPSFAKILNGKSSKSQSDMTISISPETFVVWSAMYDRLSGSLQLPYKLALIHRCVGLI